MRGAFEDQGGLFSYISPEARIAASHPLRKIRELVREVLGELNRSLGKLYALAKVTGEPLLFKGADFGNTDIMPAIA
jgi:hypothetical protein